MDMFLYLQSWKREIHPQHRFFTAWDIIEKEGSREVERVYENTKMRLIEKF